MKEKIAVYTGSRNLYADMIPALKSLIRHSSVDKIYLMIEDAKFPYELPDIVETIDVSNQTLFKKDSPNMNSNFTYLAMMRASLTKYLPQYDRVLTLDVDTIINGDIDELWDLPMDDFYMAAVPEPKCSKGGIFYKRDVYVNAGVVVWNLKKLAEDGMDDLIIQKLNSVLYPFLEQDAMSELCEGKIYLLDSKYNACDWTAPTDDVRIIHYAAIKNWNHFEPVEFYRHLPYDKLRKKS